MKNSATVRGLRLNATTVTNTATYALVIVAYFAVQLWATSGGMSSVLQDLLIPICAYVVAALSLNLTVGVLGELSLGHAGFMSVGAFVGSVAAAMMRDQIASDTMLFVVALIVGVIFAALAGVLVGIPVLRLRGDYLAIVTLAFGEIIKHVINNLYIGINAAGDMCFALSPEEFRKVAKGGKTLIAGADGLKNTPSLATFAAGFVLILITLFVIFNLVNSRSGRAVMAVRDNRIAAESVGIKVTKYKMMAFVTSAALAGAAGFLYAQNPNAKVTPLKFDFNTSILILVFVVLGGQGRMWGSIIAATALTVLPEMLREFSDYRMLVYAIVLILVMLLTNNPTLKNFFSSIMVKIKESGDKTNKKGADA